MSRHLCCATPAEFQLPFSNYGHVSLASSRNAGQKLNINPISAAANCLEFVTCTTRRRSAWTGCIHSNRNGVTQSHPQPQFQLTAHGYISGTFPQLAWTANASLKLHRIGFWKRHLSSVTCHHFSLVSPRLHYEPNYWVWTWEMRKKTEVQTLLLTWLKVWIRFENWSVN